MNQYKCPILSCGRVLENLSVLKQHLERRHPNINIEHLIPKNEQQRVMQQQINKLPKIKNLKLQEGEYKLPEVYRRSSSKNKKQICMNSTLNKSKIVSVIGQSKKVVDNTQNNHNLKRPSLNKKNSSTILSNQNQKLPELRPTNKVKLQRLPETSLKLAKQHKSDIQPNSMNITAPNFKNLIKKQISSRQKSKEKKGSSNGLEDDSHQNKKDNNDLLFIKTQEGFNEKFTKLHKHIEKRQYKKKSQASKQSLEPKEDSIQQQSPKKKRSLPKKQQKPIEDKKINEVVEKVLKKQEKITAKPKVRRENQSKFGQNKKETYSLEEYNFQERIVVFQASNIGPKLVLPSTAKIEFLFANNCKLTTINLNNLQNLRQISIQHNSIKELSFLNYENNSSIQKIFADHNQLTNLDFLPPYLQVLSVGFNNITGLQINTKELSRINTLQEIDFSFNPIRKESNYKLHLIANCFQIKKIDGIKITKFDLELAAEYNKMLDQELGLIPSNKFKNLIVSKCSNSPSTEISCGEVEIQQDNNRTEQELEREIQKLQKVIKSTRNHLNIISEQNEIIIGEIAELKQKYTEIDESPQALFEKLRNECAALELLNFLQYASEQQLKELIVKKKRQLCIQ